MAASRPFPVHNEGKAARQSAPSHDSRMMISPLGSFVSEWVEREQGNAAKHEFQAAEAARRERRRRDAQKQRRQHVAEEGTRETPESHHSRQ